jgi:hypothetical protein
LNRNILTLTIILLAISMIATPTVSACRWRKPRTVETFTTTPFVDPSTLTGMEDIVSGSQKYVNEGTIRIGWGSLRKYDYAGPLGTGTFYLKSILSITTVSGMIELPPGSGNYENVTGHGSGIYKYTLVIDGGTYGTGTLKGIGRLEFDWNFGEVPPRYEQWDTATLRPVKGDLSIKKVCVEGYSVFPVGWWWTTTKVVS